MRERDKEDRGQNVRVFYYIGRNTLSGLLSPNTPFLVFWGATLGECKVQSAACSGIECSSTRHVEFHHMLREPRPGTWKHGKSVWLPTKRRDGEHLPKSRRLSMTLSIQINEKWRN